MLGWTRREGWTILKQGRGYPGVTPGWPVARTGSGLFIPPGLSAFTWTLAMPHLLVGDYEPTG